MSSRIAIVIVAYNARHHLADNLPSLRDQTFKDFDVFVADNGSSDGTAEYLTKNFPEVRVLSFDKNYGFAHGYNLAISLVDSEYIFLLNADVRLERNCMAEVLKAISEKGESTILACKMMFFDEPNKVDYAGAQIVLAGGGYQFGFGENDTAAYCNSRIVPSACGGAMVISKKTFFKLGAFDPKYFIYYEDVDLSWRAWLMGCEVWFLAPAIVYHKHGGTMGKSWTPFKVYLAKRNQLCNAFKNLEMQNFLITFMFSVCRAVIEVAGNLVRWKLRYAWAIVAGIIEMVVSIPALVPSRAYVQRHRVFSDRQMMDRGIIERRKISFRRKTG